MTLENVLGEPALFRLTDDAELPHDMSLRERRLFVGSLNFHALMAPTRELVVHAYDGDRECLPRTTDDTTFDGLSRAYRSRLFSVTMQSKVEARGLGGSAFTVKAEQFISQPSRHIHISRDEVLAFDPPRHMSSDPIRRALRAVRASKPLLYDVARDVELLRHRARVQRRADRRNYEGEFEPGGYHDDLDISPAPPAQPNAEKAVVIGLHWFELGGAERWAFETVRLVREAGLLPIVLTNRDSHQPWIARAELDGALVIPFSDHTVHSQTVGYEQLLRGIFTTFDVRGVVVHHNQWLYDRLHWIRRSRPDVPIVDSTHIVEYRGGGYPMSSVVVEEVISAHHVISPSLGKWMTDVQGVPAHKVVMAPLGGLTVSIKDAQFRPRGEGEPLTVAFVGRMARQKAPEVFVAMVMKLRSHGDRLRFIMHGDGEMSSWIDDIIRGHGLTDVIERRHSATPVADTLDESHVLVVTSHNEGLTLTTLEAIAHGLPVISTDVGAQSDIIPARALVSRDVYGAAKEAADAVARLLASEESRRELWQDEKKMEKELLSKPSASEWFAQEVRTW